MAARVKSVESQVGEARQVPTQISIEDGYMRLDTLGAVVQELRMLAKRLLERMHTDLLADDLDSVDDAASLPAPTPKRWLAHPKTMRLSTRPRPPQTPDGSRNRPSARISKSAPMPAFVFKLNEDLSTVPEKLVQRVLLPLFRKLQGQRSGWNLSLVNVAATNMSGHGRGKGGVGAGKDIGNMFKHQHLVLRQRSEEGRAGESDSTNDTGEGLELSLKTDYRIARVRVGSEGLPTSSQQASAASASDVCVSEVEQMTDGYLLCCDECGASMPMFAMGAHYRWHAKAQLPSDVGSLDRQIHSKKRQIISSRLGGSEVP